jgi:stage II sporulation protein P
MIFHIGLYTESLYQIDAGKMAGMRTGGTSVARRVYFKVRSKKRAQGRQKFGKIVLLLLVMGVLGVGVPRMLPQSVVPVMAGETKQNETPYWGPALYLRILAKVIPGFSESIPIEVASDQGKLMEGPVRTLSLIDPRDPKNILAAQIPYMVDAGVQLQPLLHEKTVGRQKEPKIVIPLRQSLNGEGKIIIYHTHTTESFAPTSGSNFSDDLTLTVAQLGEELARMLQDEYGIPVVHNKTVHDVPRTPAYQEALPTITELLAQNPDAKLVIDLHRDGVAKSLTTTELNGEAAVKLMFMVGTRNNPHVQEIVNASYFLHEALEEIVPGLSRGIRERPLMYNQQVHPVALLIEVGGHENSLEEAMKTIPYLARALADLYNSGL